MKEISKGKMLSDYVRKELGLQFVTTYSENRKDSRRIKLYGLSVRKPSLRKKIERFCFDKLGAISTEWKEPAGRGWSFGLYSFITTIPVVHKKWDDFFDYVNTDTIDYGLSPEKAELIWDMGMAVWEEVKGKVNVP